MKAAVCYEFGKPLVIEELSLRPPRSDEVKVKVAATAICHSDIHDINGDFGGLVAGRYPLDRINEALESSAAGEALRNVIVFD